MSEEVKIIELRMVMGASTVTEYFYFFKKQTVKGPKQIWETVNSLLNLLFSIIFYVFEVFHNLSFLTSK